jgi:hypothetical protein
MKAVTDPAALLMRRLLRWLRWRLWIQERLQPSEWQVTLAWSALAGFLGALASIFFTALTEGAHNWFTNSTWASWSRWRSCRPGLVFSSRRSAERVRVSSCCTGNG